MKVVISFIVLLFSINIIKAQSVLREDTVPISCLIENFKANRTINSSNGIQFYDWGYIEEGGISLFSYSPLKYILNVSLGKISAEWVIKYDGSQSYLFLKKITPIGSYKDEAREMYSSLERRYGKDIQYGIPAKWFTGEIILLHCPKMLFGEVVSKNGCVIQVEAGHIVSRKEIEIKEGALEHSFHSQEDGSILIRGDGCWWSDVIINTDSLNRFINDKLMCNLKNVRRKEYSILLVINSVFGTMSLYTLLPETMDDEDYINMNKLKSLLEKLPVWSYGPLLTLSGKLIYGRYFKVTLSERGWTLKDYILE